MTVQVEIYAHNLEVNDHICICLQSRRILVSTFMFRLTGFESIPLFASQLTTTAGCTFRSIV